MLYGPFQKTCTSVVFQKTKFDGSPFYASVIGRIVYEELKVMVAISMLLLYCNVGSPLYVSVIYHLCGILDVSFL